jgi:hypothetical protein
VDSSNTEGVEELESPAKQNDEEKSLSDIAKEVLADHAKREQLEEVVDGEKVKEEVKEKVETEKTGEKKESDSKVETIPDENLPFHKHPRFQEIVKEKNDFKTQVEQSKPFVEYAQAITKFCHDNQVTGDDLKVAFELVALAKKDTKAFGHQLRALLENVEVSNGERLPVDLQKKLDDGIIDEETAKELSLSREQTRQSKRGHETSQQTAQQLLQQSISTSLGIWEQNKKQNDVDYDKRLPLIQDRYAALSGQNPPRTSADAVALAEKAYTEIVNYLKPFIVSKPARRVMTPTPSKGVSGDNGLKPLDSLDDLGSLVRTVAGRSR